MSERKKFLVGVVLANVISVIIAISAEMMFPREMSIVTWTIYIFIFVLSVIACIMSAAMARGD